MSPSIAVLGAGPGLGRAVAHRYAEAGYEVALVARRPDPLDQLAEQLRSGGARAHAVPADLSDPAGVPALVDRLEAALGQVDAVYFGPTPSGRSRRGTAGPTPPSRLTPEDVQAFVPAALHTLVALTNRLVPRMVERGAGAVLVAAGASALRGVPYFATYGPALAAQRNHLQSLEAELAGTGVFVGRLYVGATIANSAWHRQVMSDPALARARAGDLVVDPADLAEALWTMHHDTKQTEVALPAG